MLHEAAVRNLLEGDHTEGCQTSTGCDCVGGRRIAKAARSGDPAAARHAGSSSSSAGSTCQWLCMDVSVHVVRAAAAGVGAAGGGDDGWDGGELYDAYRWDASRVVGRRLQMLWMPLPH